MKRNRFSIVCLTGAIAINGLGWNYISNMDSFNIFLFEIFLLVSSTFIVYFVKARLIDSLIPIFVLAYWAFHMSMAIFHICILEQYSDEEIMKCLLWLLISTILLALGMIVSSKVSVKQLRLAKVEVISNKTYYSLLIVYFFYMLARFYFAGGIYKYIFSDYQFKMPESVKTLFFMLKLILTGVDYLNLLYVTNLAGNKTTRVVSIVFFAFSLINVFISGGSTGILFLLLSLMMLLFLSAKNTKQVQKYIARSIPIVLIGVYVGLLIRLNRQNYADFHFDIMNEAMDTITRSATFDGLENFIRITRDFTPQYNMGQLLYPFINWIPRSIFPWKTTELGSIMASTYHNFKVNANAGFATSPMGDFYYDNGFLGIVLGMFFLGFFVIRLQKMINGKDSNSPIALWMVVYFMYITSTIPNWYTGFGIRLFYAVVFCVIMQIIHKVFPKTKGKES